MPADPAQLQTLNEPERNKKMSDLSACYGVPGKDTITTKQLIRRVEQAATVCGWNDGQKALQLSITFKGGTKDLRNHTASMLTIGPSSRRTSWRPKKVW